MMAGCRIWRTERLAAGAFSGRIPLSRPQHASELTSLDWSKQRFVIGPDRTHPERTIPWTATLLDEGLERRIELAVVPYCLRSDARQWLAVVAA